MKGCEDTMMDPAYYIVQTVFNDERLNWLYNIFKHESGNAIANLRPLTFKPWKDLLFRVILPGIAGL